MQTGLNIKASSIAFAFSLVFMGFNLNIQPIVAAQLEEIVERGKLIVAVKDNLRPLGFTDTEGNLQGLEIEIAKQLAEKLLGNSEAVVLLPVSNQQRIEVLLEGEVDLTIARVSATSGRSRLVNFSHYYYLDSTSFVTQDFKKQNLSDLANTTVAVLNNSSTIAVVRHHLPTAKLVGVDSYQEALSILEAGEADVFAGDRSVLAGWVQEYPSYQLLPVRLEGSALCVVLPKGLQYSSLWLRVNEAILSWKESGWLEERLAHWGLL